MKLLHNGSSRMVDSTELKKHLSSDMEYGLHNDMGSDCIHMVGDNYENYKSSELDDMLVDYNYVRNLVRVEPKVLDGIGQDFLDYNLVELAVTDESLFLDYLDLDYSLGHVELMAVKAEMVSLFVEQEKA